MNATIKAVPRSEPRLILQRHADELQGDIRHRCYDTGQGDRQFQGT